MFGETPSDQGRAAIRLAIRKIRLAKILVPSKIVEITRILDLRTHFTGAGVGGLFGRVFGRVLSANASSGWSRVDVHALSLLQRVDKSAGTRSGLFDGDAPAGG